MVIETSTPRVSSIPEDKDEEAPCSSGSVHSTDFGFLIGEFFPKLSSDDNEIDEVYRLSEFRDYLANNPYQTIPKLSWEREDSYFKAKEVGSSMSKAGLFAYWRMFKVLADVHFWVLVKKDRAH